MATFHFTFFVLTVFVILFRSTNCRHWQLKSRKNKIFNKYSPSSVIRLQRHFMQDPNDLSSFFIHWLGKRDYAVGPQTNSFLDKLTSVYSRKPPDIIDKSNVQNIYFQQDNNDQADVDLERFLHNLEQTQPFLHYSDLSEDLPYTYNDDPGIYQHQINGGSITDIEETLPINVIIDSHLVDYQDKPTINPEEFLIKTKNSIIDVPQNDIFSQSVGDSNLLLNKFRKDSWKLQKEQGETSDVSVVNPVNIITTILQSLQLLLKTFSNHPENDEVPVKNYRKYQINPVAKRPANIYSPISPFRKFYLENRDEKFQVVLPLMRKYPYSNVVRLSSGCTGTLLTPYHVLTAAHCVHNGVDFKTNLEMLKIEIPDTMGFRVYYIKKISIPKAWRRSGHLSDTARASFDYAIVRLSVSVPGKRAFVPLSVPKMSALNQDMNFLGFSKDGHTGLYKSECRSPLGYLNANLIVAQCDSVVGNSGAAVYIDDPREGKRIVGVLSNIEETSRYSFIMALTWSKLYEICSMMAPLGQVYGVCPNFKSTPLVKKPPLRHIPFFG